MSEIEQMKKSGVLRIKGILLKNPIFLEFINDLIFTSDCLLSGAKCKLSREDDIVKASKRLEKNVINLRAKGPITRFFQSIASQPMKLNSGNLLRSDPSIIKPVKEYFGDGILSFPYMSDAITMFFPWKEGEKSPLHQSLPIHQDYPYMMQSSAQVVVWIPLTNFDPEVGGIEVWEGSHAIGVARQKKIGDYYEVDEKAVQEYEAKSGEKPKFCDWEIGDVVIFDSNIFHRSVPNTSKNKLRIIQVFRISDLKAGDGLEYFWRSCGYIDRNKEFPKLINFEDHYKELCKIQ